MARVRCPRYFCNCKDVQVIDKKKGNFSVAKGVLGGLLTGSDFGIIAGIEDDKHTFRCNKCGKQWVE